MACQTAHDLDDDKVIYDTVELAKEQFSMTTQNAVRF
jgi:hypothetical protein